jgi:hypothetical protein
LACHRHFLHLRKQKSGDNDEPPGLLLFFRLKKNAKNKKLKGSSSSFAIEAKQPKIMMSQDPSLSLSYACEGKNQKRKTSRDTNLLSFFATEEKKPRTTMSWDPSLSLSPKLRNKTKTR